MGSQPISNLALNTSIDGPSMLLWATRTSVSSLMVKNCLISNLNLFSFILKPFLPCPDAKSLPRSCKPPLDTERLCKVYSESSLLQAEQPNSLSLPNFFSVWKMLKNTCFSAFLPLFLTKWNDLDSCYFMGDILIHRRLFCINRFTELCCQIDNTRGRCKSIREIWNWTS